MQKEEVTNSHFQESQSELEGNESVNEDNLTEEGATEDSVNTAYEATLEELVKLLGMNDSETATLIGGGKENWTEDKSFYIGRIYEIKLYDKLYPVFTSCDDKKNVNAVSVWLENGEREVPQEEVEQWVQRLTDFTMTKAAYDEITSESGTKKWKWVMEDKIISLMWTGQLLSINMNLAIGELQ